MVDGLRVSLTALGIVGFASRGLTDEMTPDSAPPTFGIEFLIAEHASQAQVATVDGKFLVVWTDGPDGARSVRGRIFRASDGEADGPSFQIADALDDAEPSVAPGDTEFLATWTRTAEVDPVFGPKTEIRAVRISTDGEIRDPIPLLLRDNGPDETSPLLPSSSSVAWNGETWLAAWREFEADWFVRFAMIDGEGTVFSPSEPAASVHPRVTSSDSRFLIAMYENDGEETMVQLVTLNGVTESRAEIGGQTNSWDHDIASDGTDFLLVYGCSTDPNDSSCPGAATGRRTFSVEIDGRTGQERADTRVAISGTLPNTDPYQRHAAVTFGSGRWLIAREELYAGRVDVKLDDALVFAAARAPAIAATGETGLIIAHRDGRLVGRFFRFGSTPGPDPTPTPISTPRAPTPKPTAPSSPGEDESGSCACAMSHSPRARLPPLLLAAGLAIAVQIRRAKNKRD